MTNYFPIFLFILIFLVCIVLTIFFKRRVNTLIFSIPLWVMLLWLFKAGIDFSIAESNNITLRYEYELFDVKMGMDYVLSLLIYSCYFFSYCFFSFLYVISRSESQSDFKLAELEIKNSVLVLAMLFTFAYVYYAKDMYLQALAYNMSAYEYSRFESVESKPLLVLSSWIALSFSVLGFKYSTKIRRKVFGILIVAIFSASIPLGNRHILISAIILFILLSFDGVKHKVSIYIKYLIVSLICMIFISVIYFIREMKEISIESFDMNTLAESIINMTSSSEFIYSHMSMYGILIKDIPIKWGGSFEFLLSAILPRFAGIERAPDIYDYYISHVFPGATKGFSISNPAGWYLNFGFVGVVFGGAIVSLIISFLHYLSFHRRFHLLCTITIYFFISDFVGYIRSGGPEPIRAVLLIKSFLPAAIFTIAYKLSTKKQQLLIK